MNTFRTHFGKIILSLGLFLSLGVFLVYAASSYRVTNGTMQTISEWSTPRNVTNSCGADIFVPTNTSAEWTSFINGKPACVTVASAAVNGACGSNELTCSAGTVVDDIGCTTSTKYSWHCAGTNGGSTATCAHADSGCGSGGGGTTCLMAGTKILMADGTEKNIEDIKMGEKVVTYNEILKMNMTDTVLEAIHNDVKDRIIYTINLENGNTLRPNNVHSMYEVGKDGYQTIDELYERYKNGETLYFRDKEGKKIQVTGMKSEHIVTAVYNLHVTGVPILNPDPTNPFVGVGHSYYANGVLSHNAIFWIDQTDLISSSIISQQT